MKKSLKIFLATLLLIPLSLVFTACGKNNNPAPPSEEEMFQTFKTAYNGDLNYSGTYSKHYYQSSFEGGEDYTTLDITFNSSNQNYAMVQKYYDSAVSDNFEVMSEMYIVNSGDKYIMYTSFDGEMASSYVDSQYISSNNLASISGNYESENDGYLLGMNPTEFAAISSWEEFKTSKLYLFHGDMPELDFKNASITLSNDVYKITIEYGKQVSEDEADEMMPAGTFTNKVVYTYNSSHVLSYESEIKLDTGSEETSMSITSTENRKFEYEASVMKADFSEFPSLEAEAIVSEVYSTISTLTGDDEKDKDSVWYESKMDGIYSFYNLILCPIKLIMENGTSSMGKTYYEQLAGDEGNNSELKFIYNYNNGVFEASLLLDYFQSEPNYPIGPYTTNIKLNYTSSGNWDLFIYSDESAEENFKYTRTNIKCSNGNLIFFEYDNIELRSSSDTITKDNLTQADLYSYDVSSKQYIQKNHPLQQETPQTSTELSETEAVELANNVLNDYKKTKLNFDTNPDNYKYITVIQEALNIYNGLFNGK